MRFVFISGQTATCATYIINWLVFITQMKSVYCMVRTGSLNKAVRFVFKELRSFLKLSCHLCLVLPSIHYPSDIHTTTLYESLFFLKHDIYTCPSPSPLLFLHDLISEIVFGDLLYNVNQQTTFTLSALLCGTILIHSLLSRYMNTIHTWPNEEVSAASPSWWWTSDGADCYDSGHLAASNLEEGHTRYLSVKESSKMRPRINHNSTHLQNCNL